MTSDASLKKTSIELVDVGHATACTETAIMTVLEL